MNIKLLVLFPLLGSFVLFAPGLYAAEKLYKVIDKNGRVSYQDRPPRDDKSTVMEKSFDSGTDRVRPNVPSTKDQTKVGESGQKRQLEQRQDRKNKTTKGLSAEELIAIGSGTESGTEKSTSNSTDDLQ